MLAERYLDLLAGSLLDEFYRENEFRLIYLRRCIAGQEGFEQAVYLDIHTHPLWRQFAALNAVGRFMDDRIENAGFANTMIGRQRLDHLRWCLNQTVGDSVPGDLMECGVWRGGAAIFMRGFLAAHGIGDRVVWAADSFQGLPKPSLPEDEGLDLSAGVYPMLAIPLDIVRDAFERYYLLDDQVRFLPGWFKDTLPGAPVETLALLRIDADLYESTRDVLDHMYGKVSPGGFVIVDDYHCIEQCRNAVDDFRRARAIADPLEKIDWTAVYWRKSQR
ncbi:MAG: TylF/MycF/NovP-related O-methyltransferase [Bryobacteraceae bacterium]|nr:TylF/MycF/NovP-related O-methyltransferase [Bryobacteraceae bacterium]